MPPPSKTLLIDADDRLGQGQTIAAPSVAAMIDEPSLPDTPMPMLQPWKVKGALDDPRVLLADATQALIEMRAERDEARRVADTLAIALREEQQRTSSRLIDAVAAAVLARIGPHLALRQTDMNAIADAVAQRLVGHQGEGSAIANAVAARLADRLDRAREQDNQLVAAWDRYLAGQITELTTEVRALAARVERIDRDQ